MPIEKCGCGQTFAVGLFRCPRCQTLAPRYAKAASLIEKGTSTMPKITVAAGPTNAAAVEGEVGYIKPEPAESAEQVRGEHGPELVDLPTGATVKAVGDWASLSLSALRDEAKSRGLPAGGSKADLAARLADHDNDQASATAEDNAEEASE